MSDHLKLLVISGNVFSPGDWTHHTARLWLETAKGVGELHILARSTDQRFHRVSRGKVHLHLIPRGPARMLTFVLTSWWLPILVSRIRPTHIQAQSPVHGGLAAVVCGALYGVPTMVELHGEHYLRSGQVGAAGHRCFIRPLTSLAFRWATRIRSLSPEMSEELRNIYGPRAGVKIVEIPNRVDLRVFSPPKREYAVGSTLRIVSVGALNANKNQMSLIRDLAVAAPGCDLTLVGTGPMKAELVAEAKRLGVSLNLLRGLTHQQLAEVLREQDVYVHYSHSEAVSRAVLEAMAMGLPVVVSPGGFLGGIVDSGRTGIRMPGLGPTELGSAIETLRSESVRTRLGTAARSQVELNHEWGDVFAEYIRALQEMRR